MLSWQVYSKEEGGSTCNSVKEIPPPPVDADVPRGHRYATVSIFGPTDSVSSLAQPSATIRVADLLP